MLFDGPVVYHAQAGTMDAGGSVQALVELAVADGARVEYGIRVQAIVPADDCAEVRFADRDPVRARCLVVAAGAWLEPLLGDHLALPPMRATQRQIFHFPRVDSSAPPWPSVIHEDGPAVYHLAGGVDGGPGDDRKIARHDGGPAITPDTRDYAIDPANRAEVVEYVRRWLPGLVPEPRGEATCLYTSTPTEDFLLDRRGPIVVCSPCSGHGAKFAPLIGELTADLATGDADIPERFRLDAHAAGRTGAVSL
jgi:sarcosine oxidase